MKGQDWTNEELEKMQEHYGKMANKELREKYLPNRSENAIKRKASELGITLAKKSGWTKKEIEKLREYYGKISNEELQRIYLSGRTVEAIIGKASDLGITLVKSQDWTKEELKKLMQYYGKMSNRELQKTYLPNRTVNAIVGKAGILGIGLTRNPSWTKEDDETLQKYYGKIPNKELQKKYLPNRTTQAIWARANSLGIALTRNPDWSEDELEKLRRYYGKISNEELQEKYLPNRTMHAIKTKARILGFASKRGSAEANEEQKFDTASAHPTSALPTIYSNIPFSGWLSQNIGLPENFIVAYTNAFGKISEEMHQKGTIRKPLENMSPFELDLAISLIISDTDFTTKDIQEKQMCKNALKQYRYFLNATAKDSGDHAYIEKIESDRQIPETERTAIIQSRIGQGEFRKSLIDKYNGRCIITGIDLPELLVASHIKPWVASSNEERLSVNNGLLLSATYDKLFDKGLITFNRYGEIFLSSRIRAANIKRLGLSQGMRFDLQINKSMEEYLSYHRDVLFVE